MIIVLLFVVVAMQPPTVEQAITVTHDWTPEPDYSKPFIWTLE